MNAFSNICNLLASSLWVGLLATTAQAQVAPARNDTATIVTRSGNTFDITGGITAGPNRFHSFQTFGLSPAQTANFIVPSSVQTILGRVVGGNPSVINGLLRVTGSTANLYLMNPAGIVFGASARLDVAGSFTATTGNGVGFGNRWFNAIGPNDYATLVGTPDRIAFTMAQPGAIVNAGNLAVGANQNLTLLGGTVVSTGTLSAPNGQLLVAAVPGQTLVRLSQPNSVLSFEIQPLPAKTPRPDPGSVPPPTFPPPLPNAWTLPIATLPALLTGGVGGNATGLTVDGQGTVTLTGSGIPVVQGDVVVRSAIGGTGIFTAANNLTLVNSQVQASGNLSLLAKNTVLVRDSTAQPALLKAGGNLLVQGNQAIDVLALANANSGLVSGGDLVLRSAAPVHGDAHYVAGGQFRVEQIDGSAGNLFSPQDPLILAGGDVTLATFTGSSLHILAGGSVNLGNVVIDNTDAAANTISPGNTSPLNGTRTLDSLTAITRADGSRLYVNVTPTLDAAGNVQRLPVDSNQLIIDGSANPTLDIRAGIDWAKLGGLPSNSVAGMVSPTLGTTAPNRADITINSIQVKRLGTDPLDTAAKPAIVLLTNQYNPNTALTGGAIQVAGTIEQDEAGGFGGTPSTPPNLVVIDSRGTVAVADIDNRHGSVDINAVGNISTGNILTAGLDFVGEDSVVLRSLTGNIQVATIDAGANGVDVKAAGLFRAIASKSFIDADPFPGLPRPGTALGDFLIGKGYSPDPNTVIPIQFVGNFPSGKPGVSVGARPVNRSVGQLNAPITIEYGDGSTVIADQTFPIFSLFGGTPNTASTGRLVVKGGGAAFYSGSTFDPIIPGAGPFIQSDGGSGYQAVAAAPAPIPAKLFNNAQNFRDRTLTNDVSGTVGVLAIGSGSDASFYGSTQSLQFVPPIPPPPPNQNTATPPTTVTGTDTTLASLREGEAGQTTQRQLNAENQSSACAPSTTVAAVPGSVVSRSGDRSGRTGAIASTASAASSPCSVANDDTQILQILGGDGAAPKQVVQPLRKPFGAKLKQRLPH